MNTRIEKDFLGEMKIPENVLYGIHSLRAKENFPDQTPFYKAWYCQVGIVKLACYKTYHSFKNALLQTYEKQEVPIKLLDDDVIESLIRAATEVSKGHHFDQFIVPAVQGGAGTSINMNVNEIIANVALKSLGQKPGNYEIIDPVEDANIYQSTNDVIPTALKITAMHLLEDLEKDVNKLRSGVEKLENKYRHTLRIAYTQMQEAVPSSYGKLFSAYSEALSRDWWRISKCFERIKVVNLGGGAAGTGLSIPRYFIMESINELQKITGLPLTRSENLTDTTSNLDVFVEVHAILKSHAVNLEKMVVDIRMLASDLNTTGAFSIPSRQAGSSIMPGKVNPVIPEFVISAAHKVYANDQLISGLAGQGMLDLNPYLPQIGHALIDSIQLLIASNKTLFNNLISGISITAETATSHVYQSPAVCTALNPYIGYNKAAMLAKWMKENQADIFVANTALKLISDEKLKKLMQPDELLKLGFSVKDMGDK